MSSSDRFFVNPPGPLRTVDANKELLASLDRITTYNPPVHTCSTGWSSQGFYSGPTSIAYLFYKLSQLFPELIFKQQSLLDWAEAYLALGARLKKKSPDPNHCGIANETLAHLALTAVINQDDNMAKQLCSFEPSLNAEDEEGSNEWLYGRAGYLYFLRLCRPVFGSTGGPSRTATSIATALNTAIASTVSRILAAPQPWTWHGKQYLGAAHGAIGIVTQLVLSQPSSSSSSTISQLEPLLAHLLAQQFRATGNFPSSAESASASDRLVQFCHGAPGFVVSLASLAPHFPGLRRQIGRAVHAAVGDVWRRGLLTKPPCLCHGIAGNALALAMGEGEEEEGERRFEHFLAFMTTEAMEEVGWMREAGRSDEFVGLYTGEAGRAWVWGVKASGGVERRCIGYNDL